MINLNVGGFLGAFLGPAIAAGILVLLDIDFEKWMIRSGIFSLILGAILGNLVWAALFPPKESPDDDDRPRRRRRHDDYDDYDDDDDDRPRRRARYDDDEDDRPRRRRPRR